MYKITNLNFSILQSDAVRRANETGYVFDAVEMPCYWNQQGSRYCPIRVGALQPSVEVQWVQCTYTQRRYLSCRRCRERTLPPASVAVSSLELDSTLRSVGNKSFHHCRCYESRVLVLALRYF